MIPHTLPLQSYSIRNISFKQDVLGDTSWMTAKLKVCWMNLIELCCWQVPLQVVAPLDPDLLSGLHLGLEGEHQYVNAGLAIALCSTWLQRTGNVGVNYLKDTVSYIELDARHMYNRVCLSEWNHNFFLLFGNRLLCLNNLSKGWQQLHFKDVLK